MSAPAWPPRMPAILNGSRLSPETLRKVWVRAVLCLSFYALWILAVRLVALSLITYFMMSSHSRFQEIAEVYSANEIGLAALGALLFIGLLLWLTPLTSTTRFEIFTPQRFEKRFLPGFLQGTTIAALFAFAFLLGEIYRYLGFFIQAEEAPFMLASIGLRMASLIGLAYAEEFIFRHKILGYLRRTLPDLFAIGLAAVAYCLIKNLQFDLSWTQTLTLFLASLALGVRATVSGDFARGAGLLAGALIVFQAILSLPVFGNEFQGVFLIKTDAAAEFTAGGMRFLSGGGGGPLSSVLVQLLLVFDLFRSLFKNRSILFMNTVPRVSSKRT